TPSLAPLATLFTFLLLPRPPRSPLFPYTPLFRSRARILRARFPSPLLDQHKSISKRSRMSRDKIRRQALPSSPPDKNGTGRHSKFLAQDMAKCHFPSYIHVECLAPEF